MNILVTGAGGYIASRLIPQLLERGHNLRALVRRPQQLSARAWSGRVDIAAGDVTDPASLAAALKDIHSAYYLIHNMSSGHGYTGLERLGARNFAQAAEQASVKHIIYLGGLADPQQHIAPHMRSRIETGLTLREQGRTPVTEFRAGVIAGSGSISFEMIRFMTELFPLIPGPFGLRSRSQPISTQNVIDYLLAALENWDGHGRVIEIGGPQVASYRDLMSGYAGLRGHKRGFLLLPFLPVWFMALGIGLMTPVRYPIAYALVAGLSADSLVLHNDARDVFPQVRLIDFESAAREALTHLHPLRIERVWEPAARAVTRLKHEGFFIDHRQLEVPAPPEGIFEVIKTMGRENGWPFANWLWKVRGLFGVREPAPAAQGSPYEYYTVDLIEPGHLLLHSRLRAPGEGWMEWRVQPAAGGGRLTQTAYFTPRGLPGFLYWILLYPFHAFVFRGLIQAIAKRATASL